MARTAKAKSAVTVAADKARADLKAAKEKHEKSATEANKKAVETAGAKLKDAVALENRERFENVGGGRVAKLLKTFEGVEAVANRRAYSFDKEDIDAMFKAIDAAYDSAKAAFDRALSTTSEKKGGDPAAKFSFKKTA